MTDPARALPHKARRGRTRRGILVAGAALLVLAHVAGLLTPPRHDRPGPPASQVILADHALGPEFTAVPGQDRAAVPLGPAIRRRCAMFDRRWAGADGTPAVTIRLMRCASFVLAANLQYGDERSLRRDAASVDRLKGIPHALLAQGVQPGDPGHGYSEVLFRKGQYLVLVRVSSPRSGSAPPNDRIALTSARRQWEAVPGTPGGPLRPFDGREQGPTILMVALFLWFALLALAVLLARLGERTRGLTALSGPPADEPGVTWIDVGTEARDLARRAQRRFWSFLVLFALLQAALPWFVKIIGFAVCVSKAVPSRHFLAGRRKLWGRHASRQTRLGRPPLSAGLLLVLCTLTALVTPLATSVVAIFGWLWDLGYITPGGRFAAAVLADARWSEPLRRVPVAVLTVDALLAALGLAAALDAVYRGARRRSELDAPRLAEADPRASILYLRDFADDRVRIRTSPLTRRSLPEKVGIRQTEPFEELIVRYLSSYGPVRAVSDPRDPKGPLGVAREPLPMANWREPVEELIRKSRLIVVGATPTGSADGLRWELETIAGCGALDRTILLFAPRPAEEMEGHWRRFRAMAAFRAPEGIDAFADRTLAVRADSAGNWRAVHADRRSDWAYALAMSHLAEEILQAAPGSPAPTTHQAGHD